jgi:hypothetical protein
MTRRKITKISLYIIVFLIGLPFLLMLLLNLPFSRRYITQKVNAILSQSDIPVHIKSIEEISLRSLTVNDVLINTTDGDTIIYAGNVSAGFNALALFHNRVVLQSVTINNANVNIERNLQDGQLNIVAAFVSNSAPSDTTSSSEGWDVSIDKALLSQVRFGMDDALLGIRIHEQVDSISVVMNRMSIASNTYQIESLTINNSKGSIRMTSGQPGDENPDTPTKWNIALKNLNINTLEFAYTDSVANQQLTLQVDSARMQTKTIDITNQLIEIEKFNLQNTRVNWNSGETSIPPSITENNDSITFDWNLKAYQASFKNIDINLNNNNIPTLQLSNIDAHLNDFQLSNDTSSLNVENLSLAMNQQLKLHSLSAQFSSLPHSIDFQINATTNNSRVHLQANAQSGLLTLLNKPEQIENGSLTIDSTSISLSDIVELMPWLKENPYIASQNTESIALTLHGKLSQSHLSIETAQASQPNTIAIKITGEVNQLFEPNQMSGELNYALSGINTNWLRQQLTPFGADSYTLKIKEISSSGNVSGQIMTPIFNILINSNLGNTTLSGNINLADEKYHIETALQKVDLGKIADIANLGPTSANAQIDGSGFSADKINSSLSLSIDSLLYNQYCYTHLKFDGNLTPSSFQIIGALSDSALLGDISANAQFNNGAVHAELKSTLRAQLNQLNFYTDTLAVSAHIDAHLDENNDGLSAAMVLTNIQLQTPLQQAFIPEVKTSFESDSTHSEISSQSELLQLRLNASKPWQQLLSLLPDYQNILINLTDTTRRNEVRTLLIPPLKGSITLESHPAIDMLMPQPGIGFSRIDITLDTTQHGASIDLKALNLHKGDFVKAGVVRANLTEKAGAVSWQLTGDSCQLSNHAINRFRVDGQLNGNKGSVNFKIVGQQNDTIYQIGLVSQLNDNVLIATIPSQHIILNKIPWKLETPSLFSLQINDNQFIPSLRMSSGNSFLHLYHEQENGVHRFIAQLNEVPLSSLVGESLIPGNPSASITGSASYAINGHSEANVDLTMKEASWSDLKLNLVKLNASYIADSIKGYALKMMAELDSAKVNVEANSQSLKADFLKFPLNTIEPFINESVTDVSGTVSGTLSVTDMVNTPHIEGQALFDNSTMRINALNSLFTAPHEMVIVNDKKLIFNQFRILDSLRNEMRVNGYIDLSNPDELMSKLDVTSSKLQVMNTPRTEETPFYGNIFIDSKLSINGPLTNPELKGKVVLANGTEIFYQYIEDLSVSESEKVIEFVDHKAPSEHPQNKPVTNTFNRSDIETVVEIDPATKLNFNMANSLYKIDLNVKGGGLLNYALLSNNQALLSGKYEIKEGMANLKMIGWPNKEFVIKPGGSVLWIDKMDDPLLDFEAVNKISTSYTNPIDGKELYTDFFVTLKLSQRLSKLDVKFLVTTPDQYLTSILNALSPEEQMRQAISILLFERVDLPGISGKSDYMTEQVNSMLENQLNNLTKTTIKDVDISFGIDTHTSTLKSGETTTNSISYDVKKDILNKRAIIEVSGRFNDSPTQGSTKNNSANNFSFEYKLDPEGTKFLKVYNEHSYEDIFEGEIVKTGVGFSYRKSYKSLKDIWKRKEKSNRKNKKK